MCFQPPQFGCVTLRVQWFLLNSPGFQVTFFRCTSTRGGAGYCRDGGGVRKKEGEV